MKIGCRAHDYGRHSPERLAALLSEKGYQACQLAMPRAVEDVEDYPDVTPGMALRIGNAFAKSQVEISVLGCYMDLSSPDEKTRGRAVENVVHCLSLQSAVRAKCVGSESSYENLDGEEAEKSARFSLLEDSVLRIVEAAAKYGGVFAIEPVFWYPLDNMERTGALLDRVADPAHFGLIFDPANVLKRRNQHRQAEVWKEWLDAFGSRILAMHIKDFTLEGNVYRPCPLGTGVMDYTYIRTWLGQGHTDMPLLREEVQLGHDGEDLEFMRRLVQ